MAKKEATGTVLVSAPKFETASFTVVGTAPYMQCRFSEKQKAAIRENMTRTGSKSNKKEPRHFDQEYKQAQYFSTEGWNGIPASAFRNAMIRACSIVGFQMTQAKMSVFINPDGFDREDATPLVKIQSEDGPEPIEMAVRLSGPGMKPDLRVRPIWRKWSANVVVTFDADQFSVTDVSNLLLRAGLQVGIGEGRPSSKMSNGLGFGTFKLGAI